MKRWFDQQTKVKQVLLVFAAYYLLWFLGYGMFKLLLNEEDFMSWWGIAIHSLMMSALFTALDDWKKIRQLFSKKQNK